jgi:hypothetical protein
LVDKKLTHIAVSIISTSDDIDDIVFFYEIKAFKVIEQDLGDIDIKELQLALLNSETISERRTKNKND